MHNMALIFDLAVIHFACLSVGICCSVCIWLVRDDAVFDGIYLVSTELKDLSRLNN